MRLPSFAFSQRGFCFARPMEHPSVPCSAACGLSDELELDELASLNALAAFRTQREVRPTTIARRLLRQSSGVGTGELPMEVGQPRVRRTPSLDAWNNVCTASFLTQLSKLRASRAHAEGPKLSQAA